MHTRRLIVRHDLVVWVRDYPFDDPSCSELMWQRVTAGKLPHPVTGRMAASPIELVKAAA